MRAESSASEGDSELLLPLQHWAHRCMCSVKTLRRAIDAGSLPRRLVGVQLRLTQLDIDRWTARSSPLVVGSDGFGGNAQTLSSTETTSAGGESPMTNRRTTAALGVVPTPHGEVIVRKIRSKSKQSFLLRLDGPHLALRWMLPSWSPISATTVTQVTPPSEIYEEAGIAAYYQRLYSEWLSRLPNLADRTALFSPAVRKLPYATLGELSSLVESEMRTAVRPSTLMTYRHQWKAVFKHLPESTQLLDIDRTRLQDVAAGLVDDGIQPITVRKDMQALERLLKRAVEDGIYTVSPMAKVRLPKKVRRPPRFLTITQRDELLRVAANHSSHAHLLIGLGVYAGLRKAELVALEWKHVDLEQRIIQVVNSVSFTTKSGRNRSIPICEPLRQILEQHRQRFGHVLRPARLSSHTGKRYGWDFRGLFNRLVAEAGCAESCTPHTLRHTFASLHAQAGVSLFKIASWMGHSTTEMTEIYAHLAAYDPDINRTSGVHAPELRVLDKSDSG